MTESSSDSFLFSVLCIASAVEFQRHIFDRTHIGFGISLQFARPPSCALRCHSRARTLMEDNRSHCTMVSESLQKWSRKEITIVSILKLVTSRTRSNGEEDVSILYPTAVRVVASFDQPSNCTRTKIASPCKSGRERKDRNHSICFVHQATILP